MLEMFEIFLFYMFNVTIMFPVFNPNIPAEISREQSETLYENILTSN